VVRDVLRLEGIERAKDSELIKLFEKDVVERGVLPDKFGRMLKEIYEAKKEYDSGKIGKSDIQKIQKDSRELIRVLVEHIQRKRGLELEKTRIRVKHGNKYGEILLLGKKAFIIQDIDSESKEIRKADITPNGSLANLEASNLEEYEKAIAETVLPERAFIKEPLFEDLKGLFGKDVEILINY
jgi:hypothetical protein